MPHQCVRCNTLFDDGSSIILSGCTCGCKLFFYIKKARLDEAKVITTKLTTEDKKQIEEDVTEMLGHELTDQDQPVVLDLESVRILEPGKFELDLVRIFNKKYPLVYKLEEGKYVIDIAESFKRNLDVNDLGIEDHEHKDE